MILIKMARHSRCAVGFDDVVVHTRTLRRGHNARVEAACEKLHGKFPEISIADYYSNVSTLSWNEPGKNDGPLFHSFILPRPEPLTVRFWFGGTDAESCVSVARESGCLPPENVDFRPNSHRLPLIPESNRKSVNFDVTK